MDCPAPPGLAAQVSNHLRSVYCTQTAPFLQLVQEYGASLQQNRELQVRLVQLDKEASELRDEVRFLTTRLADEAKAAEWKAQAETATAQLAGANRDLEVAVKERDLLREQVTRASEEARAMQEKHEGVCGQLEKVEGELVLLREALAQTSAALEHEQAARIAAASEVQSALESRESALAEAERLRADNLALSRRLVDMKETEIERMNHLNKMHEDMLAEAAALRREADADREAAQLIRNKAGAMAAATLQAAAAAVGLSPQHPQPDSTSAADGGGSTASRPSRGGGVAAWAAPAFKGSMSGFTAPAVLGRVFGRGATQAASTHQQPAATGLLKTQLSQPAAVAIPGGAEDGTGPGGHQPELEVERSSAPGGSVSASAAGVTAGSPSAWDLINAPSGDDGIPQLAPIGLQELMGVQQTGGASDVDHVMPNAPYRSAVAHRGGCCALAVQAPGHLMVSCGVDRMVAVWDLTVMRAGAGPHQHLHGMSGGVNDCAFIADGSQVLAGGADKSIRMWNVTTGTTRHTLTGHSGPVVSVCASPLDARCAVSVSEDRTMRLWDLGRGYCVHSVSCAKMPNALAMSGDGNTIATGHVDGGVCLWDVRQSWGGGSQPLAESKVMNGLVTSLSSTPSDSLLLVASKEGVVMLWDYRMQTQVQQLKAPRFVPGTQGSMGRSRCHMALSSDGRWVAAGGADGNVYVWDLHPHKASQRHLTHASTFPAASGGGVHTSSGTSNPVLCVRSHHKDAVVATGWSADGSTLVTADKAGVVAFWSLTGWSD